MAEVDIIIPTLDDRRDSLERLLTSLPSEGANPIIVPNPPTCGAGWIEGLSRSSAPYVALIADDLEFINGRWLDVCIRTVDQGLLPCPRVYRPDGTIESQGGDMGIPHHIHRRHRSDGASTDFTTVPFCSREQIEAIGMIDTQYCCDVWVSYRGRQLGYETVLRHWFDLIHHQEQAGRGAGMDQGDRDAMDSATMHEELRMAMEPDPYASHLEILTLVLGLLEPANVLELGSGDHSTAAILRCQAVEKLVSLEDDSEWAAKIAMEHPSDRLDLTLVRDTSRSVPEDLSRFNLIFVDNGGDEATRERTIREVLGRDPRPPAVIHDAEVPAYARAIEELAEKDRRVTFTGRTPHTAVVW